MGKKDREHDKHESGGPGKAPRKGHVEPDKSGNKSNQRQPGPSGMPGEGRGADPTGTQKRERGKPQRF